MRTKNKENEEQTAENKVRNDCEPLQSPKWPPNFRWL